MRENRLNKPLLIYLLIVLVIFIAAFNRIFLEPKDNLSEGFRENIINAIRVETNPLYEYSINNFEIISNGSPTAFEAYDYKGKGLFTIIDPVGKVYYTTNAKYSNGETLDLLDVLYYDKSYSKNEGGYIIAFPLVRNNTLLGNLIIELGGEEIKDFYEDNPKKDINIMFLLMVIVNIIVIAYMFFFFHRIRITSERLNGGLIKVSKGIYEKIKGGEAAYLGGPIDSYNIMVEELTYLLKKQQDYDGMRRQFFSMISHELKTPLAAIGAYVEGLKSNIARDEETRQNYINIIHNKVNSLTYQIEDLFKYSQQDINRFKIKPSEHYAYDSFSKIFSAYERQFEGKEIKIQIENLLPNTLIVIDEIRIEQVIQNIINNAAKHIMGGGIINIKAYRQNNEIIIAIKDNGEGISPGDLPYIFDYFYQGRASKETDYQGVGLGLAICKDIIEKHGGSIKVKSREQEGSTFFIILPIA